MAFLLDLTLADGRLVLLDELYIGRSYAGLMVGRVTGEITEEEVRRIAQKVQRLFGSDVPVHTVDPSLLTDERGARRLPPYYFAGYFLSTVPAKDQEQHASSLAVIWFQESLTPPITDDNRVKMAAIPWNELALDFRW